jgi:hypothetical protein
VPDGVCVVWTGLINKPHQVVHRRPHPILVATCGGRDVPQVGAACLVVIAIGRGCGPLKALLVPLFANFDTLPGAVGGDVRQCLPIAA